MRCEQDQLETLALRARRGALDPYPAQQAIHDVHVEEFYEHRRHCASIYYALPAVREALITAFSHTNTSDLTYVRPSLIQHRQQQQEKNRRVPYRMRRYSDVLTRLPGDKKRLFSRRPHFTPKTDLTSASFDEIKENLGINVANIENGQDCKTEQAVPALKRKGQEDEGELCASKTSKVADDSFDMCEDELELRGEPTNGDD